MLSGLMEAGRIMPGRLRARDNSIPLTILSGFLGAGKTTLVNRLLANPEGRRIVVIVNDFGSIDIDAQLIRARTASTISLANGCACCTVAGDLTRTLVDIAQSSEPADAVLLEASGLADPSGIAQVALANPAMRLDGVVTLVDAETFARLSDDADVGALLASQIATADLVILNKIDGLWDGLRPAGEIDAEIGGVGIFGNRARRFERVDAAQRAIEPAGVILAFQMRARERFLAVDAALAQDIGDAVDLRIEARLALPAEMADANESPAPENPYTARDVGVNRRRCFDPAHQGLVDAFADHSSFPGCKRAIGSHRGPLSRYTPSLKY